MGRRLQALHHTRRGLPLLMAFVAGSCGHTTEPGSRHLRAVFRSERSSPGKDSDALTSRLFSPVSDQTRDDHETTGRSARLVASARRWTMTGGRVPGSIELVVRALRDAGLRFGTDRTMQTLLAYLRHSHEMVATAQARAGDVVFFDLGRDRGGCGAHAGVVESVEPGGRVTFIESREGQVRRSHFHPARPRVRRDENGMLLNTFLRAKRMDDPAWAKYHAADMVCAVGRLR